MWNLLHRTTWSLVGQSHMAIQGRNLNCLRSSITKIGRTQYLRLYPTSVVLPDGSSIQIRFKEPRAIIKLPLDLSTLSEEERKQRLARRKPKKKVKIVQDIEDNFDVNQYSYLWEKRK